jgi:hypothetical protein
MNMSYCRFENTLMDLRDCEEHLYDSDLSENEVRARSKLVDLCAQIAESGIKTETDEN